MTSTGQVGIGDKLLMGKSARAAVPRTGLVGSGTLFVYFVVTRPAPEWWEWASQ